MNKEETPEEVPQELEKKIIEAPKKIDEAPKGLRSEINDIKEQLKIFNELQDKNIKKKSFSFPRKVKAQTKNLKKLMERNKIQVMLLKQTGSIHPVIGNLKNGMIIIGDQYHNGADDVIWHWEGKTPTAIIPEWDMQPVTKQTLMQSTSELKTWIHPQTIMIRAIEAKEALEKKKKIGGKALIWIIVIVAAAAYLMFGNLGG